MIFLLKNSPICSFFHFCQGARSVEVQEAQMGRSRGGPSRAREGQEVGIMMFWQSGDVDDDQDVRMKKLAMTSAMF